MTKPISPDEIIEKRKSIIPDAVFEVVNNLIVKNYNQNNNSATINQEEIIAEILKLNDNLTRRDIFDYKYLDFEVFYEESGWIVTYDKPGYCEDYDASFTFKKK